MDFKVKAVSRAEFDGWVKDMQNVTEPEQATTDSAQQGQEILIIVVLAVMQLHLLMQLLKQREWHPIYLILVNERLLPEFWNIIKKI